MQLLFFSALRSTASKIYALKDDEKGHIINHEIHHLAQEPDRRGPTEMLMLYLPTPEIAPRSLADSPSPVAKRGHVKCLPALNTPALAERQGCPAGTAAQQPLGPLTAAKELASVPPHWPASGRQRGDAAPCCCSGSGEPSLTHFSPNQTR